jgi:hypothetical protein
MMSFIVEALNKFGLMERYPNITQYAKQLATHAAWQKTEQLEVQYG